jgi:hypothetical protein
MLKKTQEGQPPLFRALGLLQAMFLLSEFFSILLKTYTHMSHLA